DVATARERGHLHGDADVFERAAVDGGVERQVPDAVHRLRDREGDVFVTVRAGSPARGGGAAGEAEGGQGKGGADAGEGELLVGHVIPFVERGCRVLGAGWGRTVERMLRGSRPRRHQLLCTTPLMSQRSSSETTTYRSAERRASVNTPTQMRAMS